jgi:predicted nuclease of predicted toxin-antitoxin system
MRFLVDVNAASRSLLAYLRSEDHDVVSAFDTDRQQSDESLLQRALSEERILITHDTDSGELVFARGHDHGPIVRMTELGAGEQVAAIDELLRTYTNELFGRVILTVTRGRIRIRRHDV